MPPRWSAALATTSRQTLFTESIRWCRSGLCWLTLKVALMPSFTATDSSMPSMVGRLSAARIRTAAFTEVLTRLARRSMTALWRFSLIFAQASGMSRISCRQPCSRSRPSVSLAICSGVSSSD
ncbi:hypothetical protein D3C84_981610 [compost metagenome]